MAVERERGILLSTAVTSFGHERRAFNLLDTASRTKTSTIR